ncbi:MAG: Ig-like domain-containing protein [Planctomycetota bacterium]
MLRRRHRHRLMLGTAAFLAACGSHGQPTAGSAGGSTALGLRLAILGAQPDDSAVQVALDVRPAVEFDGIVARECLDDVNCGLFTAGSTEKVACDLEIDHGRRVVFHPRAPLQAEADYELRLPALTGDVDGRLLDEDVTIRFRTFDTTAPRVLGLAPECEGHDLARGETITLLCDDALDPGSIGSTTVSLRDALGRSMSARVACDGPRIAVYPVVDLRGDGDFSVAVQRLLDRSGNRMDTAAVVRFHTAVDVQGPQLLRSWPAQGAVISRFATLELAFDESVALPDEGSQPVVEDQDGGPVAIRIGVSEDQRTLRITPVLPLKSGFAYVIRSEFDGGLLDVSGNPYPQPVVLSFSVGTDETPPTLLTTMPADGAVRIDPRAQIVLHFDEDIDPTHLHAGGLEIRADARPCAIAALELDEDHRTVRCTLRDPLPPSVRVDVRVLAESDAFRDPAGNPLATDHEFRFTTSDDTAPLTVMVWPEPDTVGLPFDASLALLADRALDASTVDLTRIQVLDASGGPVPGSLALERGDRVVRFRSAAPYQPGSTYTMVVRGGPDGLRKASGNWMETDLRQQFRVGYRSDADPPDLEVTVDAVGAPRNQSRIIDREGSTLDLRAREGTDPALDLSSADLVLEGPGAVPSADVLFAAAEFTPRSMRVRLVGDLALAPGHYLLRGRVRDLSGGAGEAPPLEFDVIQAGSDERPFDRTQVVWVRFDLDRDQNGRPDFEDDLYRIGLMCEGDPLGANARLAALVRDGVLAECHRLFGRRRDGAPLGPDSIPLRATARQPLGIPAMQIACGGFDPAGAPQRTFGAASTGTLGRARYDYRNQLFSDLATSSSPGLGVFPAELFLFESRVHLDVYPGYVTGFARRFMPVAPDLAGTPAGRSALDARVLAEDFDYATATASERARYTTVMAAADDWATCVGTILAHEIGHTVGLVAPGATSAGLNGDASLHNEFSAPGEVMAAALGFDAMVALPFSFRDLNLAYLRQRIVLR